MSDKLAKLLQTPDKKMTAAELDYLAACFRENMFTVLHERGTGHWGGSSSAAELVTALYFNRMNIDPKNPKDPDRDRLILSKGHASINLYTVLAARGFFPYEDTHTFRMLGSYLQGHPAMLKVPGVDMSTGALGHGISVGVGMALAAHLSGKNYHTYVMTGEGCLNEGSSWEALMYAAKEKDKMKGLVLMIDYNKVQLDGTMNEIMPLEPLKEKLEAFGWHVCPQQFNGHSSSDILKSFDWIDSDDIWPKAVVYDTVKGAVVSFSEGKNAWHGAAIDDEHYEIGIKDLKADTAKKEALV
ncbi:MAG: transketolase [Sphaerochaetaceae bacterium]|nr:transketolase [Sphaerochaetaceae bacterium]